MTSMRAIYHSDESGITLIQMAGILVIISIMMVSFFQMQSLIRKTEKRNQSVGQVSDISQALVQFALTNGRYPLPANPVFPLADNRSGTEFSLTDSGVLTDPANIRCGISIPNDHMRCVNGAAEPYPLLPSGSASYYNRVVIGSVPYAILGLTPSQSLDEYGNKLTYAVTYGLTKTATFANDKGNIRVRDKNNSLILVPTYNSDRVHFVVISHGQNRLGAFPGNGGARSCTTTSPANSWERENCNDNSSFRALSTRPDGDTSTTTFPQTNWFQNPGTNTADTFDDLLAFRTTINSGTWTARTVPGATNQYQTYLGFREGNENILIGGGTTQAAAILSLGTGQVQVEGGGNVKADRIETNYICSTKSASDNRISLTNQARACLTIQNFTSVLGTTSVPITMIAPANPDATIPNTWMRAVTKGGVGTQLGYINRTEVNQEQVRITPSSVVGFDEGVATSDRLCSVDGARGITVGTGGDVSIICD